MSVAPAAMTWTIARADRSDVAHDILKAGPDEQLQVFRDGARHLAGLVREGWLEGQETIDGLHNVAVAAGIVAGHSEDAVQELLADAFSIFNAPEPPPPSSPEDYGQSDDAGIPASSQIVLVGPKITATPYRWCEPAAIPRREWLYGRHIIRGFVSGMVAPGGTGKSKQKTVEALEMVSGKPLLLNGVSRKALNVWLWNLEDPSEEITRNIQAACRQYDLTEADIAGRLFVNSGREQPCVIAEMAKGGPTILRPVVDSIIAQVREHKIDVVMIDPFVSCHRLSENDNSAIDLVVKEWGRVAELGACAVDLTHHTRKLAGTEVTAESSRGAKALVDACRSVRVLNRMTPQEAERAGVENHRLYFQAFSDKVNLSPPADKADWFRLVSVDLENGPPGQSDLVGVVVRWEWPDAFDGVSSKDLLAVQKRIAGGTWRESDQASDWAGLAVAEVLNFDLSSAPLKSKVKTLLKTWIESGALRVIKRMDEHRKERPFIEVGQWFVD